MNDTPQGPEHGQRHGQNAVAAPLTLLEQLDSGDIAVSASAYRVVILKYMMGRSGVKFRTP
jgi:hypothetical protein